MGQGWLKRSTFAIVGALLLSGCSGATTSSMSHTPATGAAPTRARPPAPPPPPPPPPSDQLMALAFFNSQSGYGVFTKEENKKCEDSVGPTTNGGMTFSSLAQVTAWNCATETPARSLAFDDHGDGFHYGPDLFVTHDAGAEWDPIPQPGDVLAVQALGLSIWMVESGCPQAAGPQTTCTLRLLASNDGGRTWSSLPVPPDATLDNGLAQESAQGQTWLARINRTSAYLVSNPVMDQQGGDDVVPLWFTSDEGQHWSNRQLPCAMDAGSAVVSAAPDGALLAVCASQPGAGNQIKSALRSTDGGATWNVRSTCTLLGTAQVPSCATDFLSTAYLGAIDALSADTVFLVGARSSLLVSHDGGATWQPVQPPIGDTSDGTRQVIFFTDADGVVFGFDGGNDDAATIWATTDGGANWTAVVPQVR